nr:MAG TPA: hypothetical protein [Caudoviricetes sp.]
MGIKGGIYMYSDEGNIYFGNEWLIYDMGGYNV